MNKRGFIFTFISVTLISVIVLAFLIQYSSRTRVDIEKTNTEVETMNSFVKSLNNNYLPTALRVSGNQAIIALSYYMDGNRETNDGYLTDAAGDIESVLETGRYKEELLELMEIDDINYNLTTTLNELINLANYTNIDLTIDSVGSINVFQDGPWHVNISMIISYGISNIEEDISWSYNNIVINTSIPVKNFIDPVHLLENDQGEINISIIETVYISSVDIEDHVFNTSFVACDKAPDFLGRMEQSVVASEAGIESLYDVRSPDISAIDYQYYPDYGASPTGVLVDIGEGYYIDSEHQSCHSVYG